MKMDRIILKNLLNKDEKYIQNKMNEILHKYKEFNKTGIFTINKIQSNNETNRKFR